MPCARNSSRMASSWSMLKPPSSASSTRMPRKLRARPYSVICKGFKLSKSLSTATALVPVSSKSSTKTPKIRAHISDAPHEPGVSSCEARGRPRLSSRRRSRAAFGMSPCLSGTPQIVANATPVRCHTPDAVFLERCDLFPHRDFPLGALRATRRFSVVARVLLVCRSTTSGIADGSSSALRGTPRRVRLSLPRLLLFRQPCLLTLSRLCARARRDLSVAARDRIFDAAQHPLVLVRRDRRDIFDILRRDEDIALWEVHPVPFRLVVTPDHLPCFRSLRQRVCNGVTRPLSP
uniref:Uncharacterized protein n=1 Tax=Hyaloperonospora arabidopsidis (strain Emoy2) TaxID=559515 RepID=M4BAN4_HYAAE